MRQVCRVVLLLLLVVSSVPAAVFQYAVPVTTTRGESTAFLWIPPRAELVRGVVMGGMTLMERECVKDAQIRQACADQALAIVFLKCGLGQIDVQNVLNDLAKASGYRELSAAPLFFLGHSAGGPPAKTCAIAFAPRCFGVVQYRGGVPGGGEAVPPGVPALMMVGQFNEFGGTMRDEAGRETWEGGRDALAAFRARNERNLGSIVVEPGAGHFAWSDRNAAYLALFLRKAAAARIPVSSSAYTRDPVRLREIDHRDGWLTDLTIRTPGGFPPAPWKEYRGDRARAAWHFDREMAEATVTYHAGKSGTKDQFIRWSDPHWVDAGARFFFTTLTWVGDGQTCEVHPVYAETYPAVQRDGRGPRWADAGKPVGHSTAPILVKPVSGPVAAVGPNLLRVRFDALAPATEGSRITFMAWSAGDAEYRYTEQVGMMPRGFSGLTGGTGQTITSPPIDNLRADAPAVKLAAASDSGLPVEYYVAFGPAAVEGDTLQIAELPARATFPIPVKVVAYQFGRGLEPLVKTAAPVERTFMIEKP